MWKWLRKLFGFETTKDVVEDMNRHANVYMDNSKMNEMLSKSEPPPPYIPPKVSFPPISRKPIEEDDEDNGPDLFDVAIDVAEIASEVCGGGGSSSDDDFSSSSDNSWSGDGGAFDGGGASGDW